MKFSPQEISITVVVSISGKHDFAVASCTRIDSSKDVVSELVIVVEWIQVRDVCRVSRALQHDLVTAVGLAARIDEIPSSAVRFHIAIDLILTSWRL